MVPRHDGTGGNVRMGKISKRGDVYLRTLLIHRARTVIRHVECYRVFSATVKKPGWRSALGN
jgi:transposase